MSFIGGFTVHVSIFFDLISTRWFYKVLSKVCMWLYSATSGYVSWLFGLLSNSSNSEKERFTPFQVEWFPMTAHSNGQILCTLLNYSKQTDNIWMQEFRHHVHLFQKIIFFFAGLIIFDGFDCHFDITTNSLVGTFIHLTMLT